MTIVSHIIFALFAVGFGTRNLIAKKGAGIFTLLPGRYLPNLIGIF